MKKYSPLLELFSASLPYKWVAVVSDPPQEVAKFNIDRTSGDKKEVSVSFTHRELDDKNLIIDGTPAPLLDRPAVEILFHIGGSLEAGAYALKNKFVLFSTIKGILVDWYTKHASPSSGVKVIYFEADKTEYSRASLYTAMLPGISKLFPDFEPMKNEHIIKALWFGGEDSSEFFMFIRKGTRVEYKTPVK
jgi:hypothetical protein